MTTTLPNFASNRAQRSAQPGQQRARAPATYNTALTTTDPAPPSTCTPTTNAKAAQAKYPTPPPEDDMHIRRHSFYDDEMLEPLEILGLHTPFGSVPATPRYVLVGFHAG